MAKWLSRLFKPGHELTPEPATRALRGALALEDDEPEMPEPRRVVRAPVIMDQEPMNSKTSDIRIKARVNERERAYTFLVDRPVLEGYSFWCPDPETAAARCPLAAALYDAGGVWSVLIHGTNVTVVRDRKDGRSWDEFAKAMGHQIREHLRSGAPVVAPEVLDSMPSEEEIRDALQGVIDREINPGIASHSGVIKLNRVVGNTAYITMGGGCQGCAASKITLRSGVERSFRQAVPALGALLDETDHAAGVNPFFQELPSGMER